MDAKASRPHSRQQRNGFQPAEAFLDALPFPLTDAVALMPRRAFINGTATGTGVITVSVISGEQLSRS